MINASRQCFGGLVTYTQCVINPCLASPALPASAQAFGTGLLLPLVLLLRELHLQVVQNSSDTAWWAPHAMKPLPFPGYNHRQELQRELVWVQAKWSQEEEAALLLMSFPAPRGCTYTLTGTQERGRQVCHFLFGYSAKVFGGQQHKRAQ